MPQATHRAIPSEHGLVRQCMPPFLAHRFRQHLLKLAQHGALLLQELLLLCVKCVERLTPKGRVLHISRHDGRCLLRLVLLQSLQDKRLVDPTTHAQLTCWYLDGSVVEEALDDSLDVSARTITGRIV